MSTNGNDRSTDKEEVAPNSERDVLPRLVLAALGIPGSPAVVVEPPVRIDKGQQGPWNVLAQSWELTWRLRRRGRVSDEVRRRREAPKLSSSSFVRGVGTHLESECTSRYRTVIVEDCGGKVESRQ